MICTTNNMNYRYFRLSRDKPEAKERRSEGELERVGDKGGGGCSPL